ncbi:AraC family transcriptional regulator [Puniceicoccaceae bacterium]|nr:AraC family transcriptional regulator [Puniceicoccaceae bacterium]
MAASQDSLDGFPSYIKDPKSYYVGVDLPDRVICRNVIVFDRLTRRALQQQHLANRMHHRYVLIRVLKTTGVVSVDGKSFQLNEGDALLVAPYQFHHFIDLQSDQLRWLFITFDLAQGESMLADLSYRSLQPDRAAHRWWGEIAQIWTRKDSAQRSEIMPLLDRMLTRLQSTMAARVPGGDDVRMDSKNEWIVGIEALIIRSVKEGWTFEEVAQRAGFSERHLRNRFEQQMGLSLRDYRSNYQLHTAISLMRDMSHSLSDIAELSGFNSQSVFTRFIRRMAELTPRELCRQVRQGRYEPS